jgi:hypothetical protein
MSEKIYTRLFRLYPSRFRREYESEALQLIRDRLRDENGFWKRARLWWDLVADVFTGLPGTYRNSYAVTESALLSPNVEGIPSFKVLEQEPLRRGSILLGGTLSVSAMVSFGFLLSLSINHLPVPGPNGRRSPIEAVMDRLNRATTPDTAVAGGEDASRPGAVRPGEREPRPVPPAPASTSKVDAPALIPVSKKDAGLQKPIVSAAAENSTQQDASLAMPEMALEGSAWKGALTDISGRPVRSAEIHVIGGHGELVVRTAEDGSFAFFKLSAGDCSGCPTKLSPEPPATLMMLWSGFHFQGKSCSSRSRFSARCSCWKADVAHHWRLSRSSPSTPSHLFGNSVASRG